MMQITPSANLVSAAGDAAPKAGKAGDAALGAFAAVDPQQASQQPAAEASAGFEAGFLAGFLQLAAQPQPSGPSGTGGQGKTAADAQPALSPLLAGAAGAGDGGSGLAKLLPGAKPGKGSPKAGDGAAAANLAAALTIPAPLPVADAQPSASSGGSRVSGGDAIAPAPASPRAGKSTIAAAAGSAAQTQAFSKLLAASDGQLTASPSTDDGAASLPTGKPGIPADSESAAETQAFPNLLAASDGQATASAGTGDSTATPWAPKAPSAAALAAVPEGLDVQAGEGSSASQNFPDTAAKAADPSSQPMPAAASRALYQAAAGPQKAPLAAGLAALPGRLDVQAGEDSGASQNFPDTAAKAADLSSQPMPAAASWALYQTAAGLQPAPLAAALPNPLAKFYVPTGEDPGAAQASSDSGAGAPDQPKQSVPASASGAWSQAAGSDNPLARFYAPTGGDPGASQASSDSGAGASDQPNKSVPASASGAWSQAAGSDNPLAKFYVPAGGDSGASQASSDSGAGASDQPNKSVPASASGALSQAALAQAALSTDTAKPVRAQAGSRLGLYSGDLTPAAATGTDPGPGTTRPPTAPSAPDAENAKASEKDSAGADPETASGDGGEAKASSATPAQAGAAWQPQADPSGATEAGAQRLASDARPAGADMQARPKEVAMDAPATAGPDGSRAVEFARTAATETAAPAARSQELALQIADRIQVQLRDGAGAIRIQLKPDGLGQLEIRAETTANGLVARIATESSSVKGYLENNLHVLQSALQNQGLKVDRIQVTVQNGFDSQSSSFAAHSGPSSGGQQGRTGRQTATVSSSASLPSDPEEMTVDAATYLSLRPHASFYTVA